MGSTRGGGCCGNIPLNPINPIFLQQCSQPCMHAEQLSSKMVGRTTARWPGARPSTPSPTASMMPLNSWPIVMGIFSPVIGCSSFGMRTGPEVYSWRSAIVLSIIEFVRFDYIVRSLSLTAAANSHVGWLHLEMGQIWLAYTTLCCHTFTSPFPQTGSSSFSTRISPLPWNRTAVAVIVY